MSLVGSHGEAVVVDGSTLVLTATHDEHERFVKLLGQLTDNGRSTWCIQFFLVSLDESDREEYGLDVAPSLELAATFAAGSALPGQLANTAALSGSLSAILQAAKEQRGTQLIAEPLFLLNDGAEGRFQLGDSIPVPRRVVSDQGTVTTAGYDHVETGVIVTTDLRETSGNAARLNVAVELSQQSGSVDDAPIVSKETFTATADIVSQGVYLLGEVQRKEKSRTTRFGLSALSDRSDSAAVIQVWCRVQRVR